MTFCLDRDLIQILPFCEKRFQGVPLPRTAMTQPFPFLSPFLFCPSTFLTSVRGYHSRENFGIKDACRWVSSPGPNVQVKYGKYFLVPCVCEIWNIFSGKGPNGYGYAMLLPPPPTSQRRLCWVAANVDPSPFRNSTQRSTGGFTFAIKQLRVSSKMRKWRQKPRLASSSANPHSAIPH